MGDFEAAEGSLLVPESRFDGGRQEGQKVLQDSPLYTTEYPYKRVYWIQNNRNNKLEHKTEQICKEGPKYIDKQNDHRVGSQDP